MRDDEDAAFTLAFVGYASDAGAERAGAFEDGVLALLGDHGATLLYRGRRGVGEDPSLPLEVHLIRFPNRAALDGYIADDRRQALLRSYGEVFDVRHAVRLETLVGP
ncbi:MAG TPA: hypothetical protein VIA06_24420 [Candidatus Dormibacteraeota bacterium]|jgi:hypothetical protein|nr:hypothetical protein [Candidatus Dormibacteraeota bacterium]